MDFSKMKIVQKLNLIFFVMFVFVFIMGSLGWYTVYKSSKAINYMNHQVTDPMSKINLLTQNFQEIRILLRDILVLKDKSEESKLLSRIETNAQENTKLLQNIKIAVEIRDVQSKIEEVAKLREERISVRKDFLKLVSESKIPEAQLLLSTKLNELDEKYLKNIHDIAELLTSSSDKIDDSFDDLNLRSIYLIIGFALSFFVLGYFLFSKLKESIIVPINVCVDVFNKLSNKDLSARVNFSDRSDEFGTMGVALDKFINEINTIIKTLKDSSLSLANTTNEINKNTMQISDGANQQAASFEELTSAVQSNAGNASDVSRKITDMSKDAELAQERMESTVHSIGLIEQTSKQISATVSMITDIADQTNLLALNAAIEAARAGVHGQGFAVVADEVRKLAVKSAESAKLITTVIQDSMKQVTSGVTLTKAAGESVNKILEEFGKISVQVQSISDSTQEQSAGMEENASITSSNAAAAEALTSSSQNMSSQAEKLKEIVAMFKVS